MATNRFYYLPWRLRSDLANALGSTSWWPRIISASDWRYAPRNGRNSIRYGSEGYDFGNVWSQTDADAPMAHYAVTMDPNRVPATQSTVDTIRQANTDDSWPDEPSYRFWSGTELRVSAYHATTMNDPTPPPVDTHVDERGPFEYFEFFYPAFFSAYELYGTTSINGGQFVCAGYQPYQNVSPTWTNFSLGASHSTYYSGTPTGYGPFQYTALTTGLTPYCIYVFRPSTGAVVGLLAWDAMGTTRTGTLGPSNPATMPTATQRIEAGVQGTYNLGSYNTVTGIQNGDLLVWEWWVFSTGTAWMMNPDAQVTRPMVKAPFVHARQHFGGGVSGQPLTFDGSGKPNWAPAHRAEMTTSITGVEPYEFTTYTPTAVADARIAAARWRYAYGTGGGGGPDLATITVYGQDVHVEAIVDPKVGANVIQSGLPAVDITRSEAPIMSVTKRGALEQYRYFGRRSRRAIADARVVAAELRTKTATADAVLPAYTAGTAFADARIIPQLIDATTLKLHLDANNSSSYPGSGTTWTNLIAGQGNGTLVDGPTYNTGPKRLTFDGVNDRVHLPYNTAWHWSQNGTLGPTTLTVELWVKTSDSAGSFYSAPWNGLGQYNINITPTYVWLMCGSSSSNSMAYTSNLADGVWHHVVLWANSTTMGYSIDAGVQSDSKTHGITGGVGSSGNGYTEACLMSLYPYTAGWGGNTDFSVAGDLAQVRVYHKVLSAAEISQNYEATKATFGF